MAKEEEIKNLQKNFDQKLIEKKIEENEKERKLIQVQIDEYSKLIPKLNMQASNRAKLELKRHEKKQLEKDLERFKKNEKLFIQILGKSPEPFTVKSELEAILK